ncbi:MAG: type II secretion system protein [Gaiellaceae bacterium]
MTLRSQAGFGLVETLIAMTVLNVALLALVASLNSGAVALARAGEKSNAGSLAHEQLELYRALAYPAIALDTASAGDLTAADTAYACDEAIAVDAAQPCSAANRKAQTTIVCAQPLPNECIPSRTVAGADGGSYRVDTYVVEETASGLTARPAQVVSVVVRDGDDLARELARLESTFDEATG